MKKAIFIITITVFMTGAVLTSCQSSGKKDDTVKENKQQEVQKDAMNTEHDSAVQKQKATSAEE